jgi:hypothetical protein
VTSEPSHSPEDQPAEGQAFLPEARDAWEAEEEAELAEDMLEAEASGQDLAEIEGRLEILDAQEDTAEALARAEAAGEPAGAAPETPLRTQEAERDMDEVELSRVEDALGPEPPSGDAWTETNHRRRPGCR